MSENDDELLEQRVRTMLNHCEIGNIRALEFAAQRFEAQSAPVTAHITSETSYQVNESAFRNRYTWRAQLVDEDDAPVAELNATLLVEYDVHKGFEPDAEAAAVIAGSTGLVAAYPYVRELFQSSTARLQIDPVVLGMVHAGTTQPRAVTMTRSSTMVESGQRGTAD